MEPKQDLNDSLPLPADRMPECWEKDERMNSLFAHFRNRSVNPQDWDSKYTFWRGVISEWASYKMCCSFSLADLNGAFKRNGRTPLCLATVVQELHRNGEIVLASDFIREPASTWAGWAVDTLVKGPLFWSFSKVKNSVVAPSTDIESKYIHMKTVKELGEIILSTVDNGNDNTLQSLSEVTKNCLENTKNKYVSEENVKLALIWLRHDKKAAFGMSQKNVQNGYAELLVKLSTHAVREVTEAEEALYNLVKQEELLIQNLELLELEKEAIMKNARTYLASGMRQVAKSCLRKKKELDRSIDKRAAALQNVQVLASRVRDAHSDSEVLAAYKTGAVALRKKLDESGLTEDSVAETMNDLSEVLEEFNELESALSKSVENSDSELEDELAELLAPPASSSVSPILTSTQNTSQLPDLEKELSLLRLKELPLPPKMPPSVKSPVPSQGE